MNNSANSSAKGGISVKAMAGIGLLTAIVVVLQLLGSFIHFGIFSISLVLVPIVVGAAVYGAGAGAFLGLAFGVTVLLSGDAGVFLAASPIGTIITVLAKGILCGLVAGIVYKLLEKLNTYVAVAVAAVVAPVVNTGIFLIGCKLFFMSLINEWAAAAGFENVGLYMIIGLAGVNFLLELAINVIMSPAIIRILKAIKKFI